jgi:lysylphosphatidylglycerol synthetase-like protein (DUF2156 family)
MPTTVLLLLLPISPIGRHLPLVRNWVKMIEEAHVWVPTLFKNCGAGLYWSLSMSWIHNLAVAAMSTTVLLFHVPIWPRGHHLPLVRNRVKVTEEAHVWVPTYFKWCSGSILIIMHVLNSQFGGCCNVHHCFVLCSYLTKRPPFATGEESSQSDWRSTCVSTNLF